MDLLDAFILALLLVAIVGSVVACFIYFFVLGLCGEKAADVAKGIIALVLVISVFVVTSTIYKSSNNTGGSSGSSSGGSSHSCCICGASASKVYGGDWWCIDHYYKAKGMDGDFSP